MMRNRSESGNGGTRTLEGVLDRWRISGLDSANQYLETLVNHRNLLYPEFSREDGGGGGGGEGDEFFEMSTMTVVDEVKSSTGPSLELEGLRFQDRTLRDEVANISTSITIINEQTQAEVDKYEKKMKELERKTELNKLAIKEVVSKTASLKEERKNKIMLAKQLVDRIDLPTLTIRRFCKVSEEGICQDRDFCREFSGGKCGGN